MSQHHAVTSMRRTYHTAACNKRTPIALLATLAATLGACADEPIPSGPELDLPIASAQAPFSGPKSVPTRGRILFSSLVTGDNELYSMKEDGTGIVRLTYSTGDDTKGAFSPDGKKIAFLSNREGSYQVYVMNTDGSGLKRLTNISAPSFAADKPSWSPDGRKIVLGVGDGGPKDIYIMSSNGTSLTPLLTGPDDDSEPSFAPDGTHIAFTSNRGVTTNIWVMNTDGSNPTQLTNCASPCFAGAISPDGKKVAYNTIGEVHVLDLVTHSVVPLPFGGNPVWAPDALKLAFTQLTGGPLSVATVNVDGSGLFTINFGADAFAWSWSRAN